MDRLVCLVLVSAAGFFTVSPSAAHFPDTANLPVHPRFDPIPPLGNHMPSHRERYNRPTYLGGMIAYLISPTSQEAMSWHRSAHRGYYVNHAPRMEDRYYYPKPWEALTVGQRIPATATAGVTDTIERELPSPNRYSSPDVERNDEPFELGPALQRTIPSAQ